MAASRRSLAALLAALLLSAAPVAGQGTLAVAGRVVAFRGGDTLPQAGVRVTLHAVGPATQGAVDSAVTGPGGRFRFRRAGDTAVVYLVSARFAGIEYFGEPVRMPGAADVLLAVADTSSSAPVTLAARRLVIRRPDSTGARPVLDIVSLRNRGTVTRVAPDTTTPTARIPMPAGILDARVQDGDVSAASVEFRGDTLLVFAPLPPGGKDLMLGYRIPASARELEWAAPADSFDILAEEDRGVAAAGAGLAEAEPVELLGEPLRRWTAAPPTAGVAVVRFRAAAGSQRVALLVLVVLLALAVGGGALVAFRRPRALAAPPAPR